MNDYGIYVDKSNKYILIRCKKYSWSFHHKQTNKPTPFYKSDTLKGIGWTKVCSQILGVWDDK